MTPAKIKIGYAPTRRSIFSAPAAIEYRNLTADRLRELGVDFVDITDINKEGLLYDDNDLPAIVEKFKAEKVDGIFFPHGNFGTEYEVARLAKEMNLPVLLWGPRDECPDPETGVRLRDSQCGLFATGKVLRRFRVPFTYMTNCNLTDPEFERGIKDFLAVCNIVRTFRHTRILQISTRPFDFWSTMCNEGELLEKFNIQLSPVPMTELVQNVNKAKEEKTQVEACVAYMRMNMDIHVTEDELYNVAAMKVAIETMAKKYGCNAAVIQCWNALQDELGVMPCCANSLLFDEGFPVVCETDIHGAITSLLIQAAGMDEHPVFFADWTVRHPTNDNAELLQHCGPWPLSLAKERPQLTYPLAFDYPVRLLPSANTATLPSAVLTATTANTACCSVPLKVLTVLTPRVPISGSRSKTGRSWRQRLSKAPIFITVPVFTAMLSRDFTKPANTSASSPTFMTITTKKSKHIFAANK